MPLDDHAGHEAYAAVWNSVMLREPITAAELARNRARKADEAHQDWVRQMRDRAFVENRYDER